MPSTPEHNINNTDLFVAAKACDELWIKVENKDTLVRAKRCCFCYEVKRLGQGSSDHSLIQHMLSKACLKVRNKTEIPKHARAKPEESVEPGSRNLQTCTESSPLMDCSAGSSVDNLVVLNDSPGLEASEESSGSISIIKTRVNLERIPIPGTLAQALITTINIPSSGGRIYPCLGVHIEYGQSMFAHYPWHLHQGNHLPYIFDSIDPGGRWFRFRSIKCDDSRMENSSTCSACLGLVLDNQFQEIMQRASPGYLLPAGFDTKHRTYSQLVELLDSKTNQAESLKLEVSVFAQSRGVV